MRNRLEYYVVEWHLDALAFVLLCAGAIVLARLLGRGPLGPPWRTVYASAIGALMTLGLVWSEAAGDAASQRLQHMVMGYAPTYAIEMERLGAALIEPDTPADSAVYLRLIEQQKQWLSLNSAVADIYTYQRSRSGRVVLLVDSETDYDGSGLYDSEREMRTDIGEEYELVDDLMLEPYWSGCAMFDDEVAADRWGTWVSAYAPIRSPGGEIHSILGVDYDASEWMSSMLSQRAWVLMLVLFVIALLCSMRSLLVLFVGKARSRAETDARQQFLAHVSHELRTPLTAILGNADLLGDGAGDEQQVEQSVLAIRRNGNHMLELLNDILDIARIEAGNYEVRVLPVDVRSVVADIVQMQQAGATHKHLAFRVEVEDGLPMLMLDARAVRQILLNLVGNAIKFTASGGVSLRVGRRGDRLCLEVEDTGPGIPSEVRARLFVPFEQGERGMQRRFGGTGLGLAISRQLAQLCGGDIELDSEVGEGSVFRCWLPFREVSKVDFAASLARTSSADLARGEAGQPTSGRVLVVDDGADNRLLLCAMLGRMGLEVDAVDSGEACLQRVFADDAPAPDVILMDIQMPAMDGCEATRQLRRLGFAGSVLAVTAHAMPSDRQQCLAAGCNGYLSKPIHRVELQQAVAGALSVAGNRSPD